MRSHLVVPLALLAGAAALDLIDMATGTGAFNVAAYWMIAAGAVGGLAAAPFGFIRIGVLHGSGMVAVALLFVASWLLREPEAEVPALALVLSFGGAALALGTAWLGAQRVRERRTARLPAASPSAKQA